MNTRDHSFDNLRFFLILLVVIGHLLEIVHSEDSFSEMLRSTLYLWIYSIHMPAFIFLSGFFSKFSVRSILKFLVLYVIFQTAYILFSAYVLEKSIPLQFATPYWIMWYIVVLLYDYLTIPLLDRLRSDKMRVISISVIVALLAGYIDEIGYPYSLSRFIVFFPFFVVGYYMGRNREDAREYILRNKKALLWFGIMGLWIMVWMTLCHNVTASFLYGSSPYTADNQILLRGLHFIMAFAAIGMLLVIFIAGVNFRIPFATDVGRATVSVYLLHGFILRYLSHRDVHIRLIHVPFFTMAVLLITGNRFVRKLFQMLFQMMFFPVRRMLPKAR